MAEQAPDDDPAGPDGVPVPAVVRVERDGSVVVLTLHRPDQLNAFTGTMGEELCAAYRAADADESVRAVVLTGAGRAFCAGADMSRDAVFGKPSDGGGFRSDPFTFHAWDVRKPVIAAINGHAVGIGLTLSLHCDLRIVAADAKLGVVQVRRGVLPDARAHWTLPRLVGHARAAELALTGRMFSGIDAGAWGLANEVLPADRVLDRALEIAHEIATSTAPRSVALSKRILWSDVAESDRVDELERLAHLDLMGRPDAVEGVHAFVERRDPAWTSRLDEDWPTWA